LPRILTGEVFFALQFEFGSTDYHVARYAELTKS
jgi:hypothetical protein